MVYKNMKRPFEKYYFIFLTYFNPIRWLCPHLFFKHFKQVKKYLKDFPKTFFYPSVGSVLYSISRGGLY